MPARNYKGRSDRVDIQAAAAARTHGVPTMENGWHGIPITKAALGEGYTLQVEGEVEVPFISTSVVGTLVYITAADNTLAITSGSGKREFGKVTRIQGDRYGTPTGKMWVKFSPYAHSVTA